ncbi:MAG TPA: YhdH/YhfP family quinone oxidoreductase [Candidatus Binatia bacterium]|nr:YhdH/YhfP family quinone oxidoreductase [Candidatus Binatia bacterium]
MQQKLLSELPPNEVLIEVKYSSLNYKDALSATGNKGVTRNYPHTPGIDAAGVVAESSNLAFEECDEVIVTGFDLGMNTSGGFCRYIRVPAAWVLRLPGQPDFERKYGLWHGRFYGRALRPEITGPRASQDSGEVLVTGATGGVGSIAVGILAQAGFHVVAATGKTEEKEFLIRLGAEQVISRAETNDTSERPMLKSRWAGVVGTVGRNILATAIKSTKDEGCVACCGNAMSADLAMSVFPFILRGVSLLGVNSVDIPIGDRLLAWQKLA